MSNDTTNTTKRIKYGFKLEFPEKPFTVKLLTSRGARPSYITAYKRVQKALADNLIEVVGEVTPKSKRRGAREKLYSRINAKKASVTATTASVEVPAAPIEAVAAVSDGNPF
jgi:hypothetical protein